MGWLHSWLGAQHRGGPQERAPDLARHRCPVKACLHRITPPPLPPLQAIAFIAAVLGKTGGPEDAHLPHMEVGGRLGGWMGRRCRRAGRQAEKLVSVSTSGPPLPDLLPANLPCPPHRLPAAAGQACGAAGGRQRSSGRGVGCPVRDRVSLVIASLERSRAHTAYAPLAPCPPPAPPPPAGPNRCSPLLLRCWYGLPTSSATPLTCVASCARRCPAQVAHPDPGAHQRAGQLGARVPDLGHLQVRGAGGWVGSRWVGGCTTSVGGRTGARPGASPGEAGWRAWWSGGMSKRRHPTWVPLALPSPDPPHPAAPHTTPACPSPTRAGRSSARATSATRRCAPSWRATRKS